MITRTSLTSPRLINRIKAAAIDSVNTRKTRWVRNRHDEPFMYVQAPLGKHVQFYDLDNRNITTTVLEAFRNE